MAIRFHLHPEVELFRDNKGRLVLAAPQADRWFFSSNLAAARRGIDFLRRPRRPAPQPPDRAGLQASEVQEVRWQFQKRRMGGLPQAAAAP